MQYENRWEKIETIGAGGQGEVFRVFDKHKVSSNVTAIVSAIGAALRSNTRIKIDQGIEEQIRKGITGIVRDENPINHGALKILHSPNEARNFEDAEERLNRELKAMQQADHPNLLKIVDHNADEKWFVSKYYPSGTLKDRSGWFTGQVERTLTAIRPIVDGVAALHEKGFVHRDIKPENIFVDESEQLILGDFGLVHFTDRDHTRLSDTVENVGSRDWMPPWAIGMRLEEVRPSFDVFSLGKTIWSMVSTKPIFPFWDHRKESFDVQRMFPRSPQMEFLNRLLDKCIVENEGDCWPDASWLRVRIDDTLRALELGADPIGDFNRPCRVCGFGVYNLFEDITNEKRDRTKRFGLNPEGSTGFKIFICDYCGHVQLFFSEDRNKPLNPRAWNDA